MKSGQEGCCVYDSEVEREGGEGGVCVCVYVSVGLYVSLTHLISAYVDFRWLNA